VNRFEIEPNPATEVAFFIRSQRPSGEWLASVIVLHDDLNMPATSMEPGRDEFAENALTGRSGAAWYFSRLEVRLWKLTIEGG